MIWQLVLQQHRAVQIHVKRTKSYRNGGINCQENIFAYESTLQNNEIYFELDCLLGEVSTPVASCSEGTFHHHCCRMGTEKKGSEGVLQCSNRTKHMKGEDLFHKLPLQFSLFFCLCLELEIHSQAAELKRVDMDIDLQCRSSRKKHIKEADHPTAAFLVTSLMPFKQQAGMCQMATQRDDTPKEHSLSSHVLINVQYLFQSLFGD